MQNHLRGVVMSSYPSISSFAKAIHWDRKKASRIINNKQQPSTKDITEIVDLLDIKDPSDFLDIFFSDLSTLRTKEEIDPLHYKGY